MIDQKSLTSRLAGRDRASGGSSLSLPQDPRKDPSMSDMKSLKKDRLWTTEEAADLFHQGELREALQAFDSLLQKNPEDLTALAYHTTLQELLGWGVDPLAPPADFGTVLKLYHEKKYQAARRWLSKAIQQNPDDSQLRTFFLLLSEKILQEGLPSSSGPISAAPEKSPSGSTPIPPDPMSSLTRWIFGMAFVLLLAQGGIFAFVYPKFKREEPKKEESRPLPSPPSPQIPPIDRVLRYYHIARAFCDEKLYADAIEAIKEARAVGEESKKFEKLFTRLEIRIRIAPLMEMGAKFVENKAYKEAAEFFQKSLKEDPENLVAKTHLQQIEDKLKEAKAKAEKDAKAEKAPPTKKGRRKKRR